MGHTMIAKEDAPLILKTQLEDGAENKFVIAHVIAEPSGVALAGSPFALTHQARGRYTFRDENNLKFPSGSIEEVHAQYLVYKDSGHSDLDCYGYDLDVWQKDQSASTNVDEILDKVCQILNTISSINQGADLVACIDAIEICGYIEVDELCGVVEVIELCGYIENEDELFAWIEIDDELIGVLEEQDA